MSRERVETVARGIRAEGPLLSGADLAELDRLRRHLGLRTASEGQGVRLSRRRGQSPEFVDHRGYTAGDDLRRLDWNVFARSGQAVIKRYRAEEEAAVRVVLDASASMGAGEPPKIGLARRVAAALAYVALADGERVQVASLRASGAEVTTPRRGRGQYGSIERVLARLAVDEGEPGAQRVHAEASMAEVVGRCARPGVLFVVTDALDPDGDLDAWPRALGRARVAGHDVRLVHLLSADDVDPPWDGDLELEDVETGALLDVTFDPAVRAAYAQHLEALVGALREGCRRAGATYTRVVGDDAVVAVVRRIAGGGIA